MDSNFVQTPPPKRTKSIIPEFFFDVAPFIFSQFLGVENAEYFSMPGARTGSNSDYHSDMSLDGHSPRSQYPELSSSLSSTDTASPRANYPQISPRSSSDRPPRGQYPHISYTATSDDKSSRGQYPDDKSPRGQYRGRSVSRHEMSASSGAILPRDDITPSARHASVDRCSDR